jgi:serine O-acetyltransferase
MAQSLSLPAPTAFHEDLMVVWRMTTGSTVRRVISCLHTPGLHALGCYRFGRWLSAQSVMARILLEPFHFLWFRHVRIAWGIEIGRSAQIGPGCYIGHFGGIIISGNATMGARVYISQGVTIGEHRGCPTLGDDVYLGPGAKLYGKITIGNNVMIGPNAVVHKDVEENAVVAAPECVVLSHRGWRR